MSRSEKIKDSLDVLKSVYPDVVKVLMSRIDSQKWVSANWIQPDIKIRVEQVLQRLEDENISVLLDDVDFLELLRDVTGVQFKGDIERLERDSRTVVERLSEE